MSDGDYWNASDTDRTWAASNFKNASDLRYCKESSILPRPSKTATCRYLDEEDIVLIGIGTCVVSTRVSTMVQELQCMNPPNPNGTCVHLYVPTVNGSNFFVAQPEEFTIMLDHEVFTPTTGQYGKANDPDAQARLRLSDDDSLIAPNSIYPGFKRILNRDTISVRQLMAAAGVHDLDDPAPGLFDAGSTMRYTGITLLLKIQYSNYQPWGFVQSHMQYEYQVSRGSVYEALHKTYLIGNTTRMFENRHGVTIIVAQIGKLSSFDMLSFTTFIASCLALLTITNVLVDRFALWILREGKAYERAKYIQTEPRDDIAEFLAHRKAQGNTDIGDYETFREELRLFREERGGADHSTPLLAPKS